MKQPPGKPTCKQALSDSPAVRVDNVSKHFLLGQSHESLGDLVAGGFRRLLGRGARQAGFTGRGQRRERFTALDNVSLDLEKGEAVGIIGPNGAGKSTMLKLLAGILRPNEGSITVHGRLAALIEVGAGFHGDLTGRENIFLNGAILGLSRGEIQSKLDAIVAFAGLDRFLDTPVKRYSSGMYARLGFSIAAHVNPDVLLIDEVLSVGDAVFRLRCLERMRDLVRSGTTLVFVTHNLDQMHAICPRAMVLDCGRSVFFGNSRDAVRCYMDAMSRSYAIRPADLESNDEASSSCVSLTRFELLNEAGDEVVWITPQEPVRAAVSFRCERAITNLIIEVNMRASVHENVLSFNSGRDGERFSVETGDHSLLLSLPNIPLAGGQFFWNVRMWDADSGEALLDTPFQRPLAIDDGGRATGIVTIDREWVLGSELRITNYELQITRSSAVTRNS